MSPRQIQAALAHLNKDPRMRKLIKKYPTKPEFERGRDPFHALIRSIVYQQLSGKAAGTILARFVAIKGRYPTPQELLKIPLPTLRKAGLSGQKAAYLKDLAAKFLDGTINPKLFTKMTDEEIRTHVIAVKGIGRWTADMFLMFTLHRPDVLPTGDLGIQKAIKVMFGLRTMPNPEKMEQLSEAWAPYRTVACVYLWRSLDNR